MASSFKLSGEAASYSFQLVTRGPGQSTSTQAARAGRFDLSLMVREGPPPVLASGAPRGSCTSLVAPTHPLTTPAIPVYVAPRNRLRVHVQGTPSTLGVSAEREEADARITAPPSGPVRQDCACCNAHLATRGHSL